MLRFRSASSRFGLLFAGLSCEAFLALAGCSLLASCSSGDSGSPPSIVGRPDRRDDGVVSIDEVALTGSLESGALSLDIPIVAHAQASGTLKVKLESVDGKRTLGTTNVTYALGADETATLHTSLVAPSDVTSQADLAQYNVVVEETRADRVRVIRSLMYVIPLYEVAIEGPSTLHKGKPGSYRVKTQDGLSKRPIADVDVAIEIDRNGVLEQQTLRTSATGDGVLPVATDDAGKLTVSVKGTAFGISAELAQQLEVKEDSEKLLLTTDKPVYKPGQTLHLRSLTLAPNGNAPVAKASVTFEILDAKGNKILKRALNTDAYGVAATDFQLGPIVNEGTFTVRVSTGDVKSQKTVEVSQYALPKFDVAVKTEKAWYKPAQVVSGTIDAHYFFGKLVSGGGALIEAVSLDVGETVFQQVMGKLDENGHYQFSIQLPSVLAGTSLQGGNALVNLRVTITDTAGQKVTKNVPVTVAQQGASLSLVPEATELVPGIENRLMLFLSDPLGAPMANADVALTALTGEKLGAKTDAFGQAELGWTPDASANSNSFSAVVTTETGEQISQTFSFRPQAGSAHLIVRTDKSVYETGESVKVEVLSSDDSANVYLDWLNDGQAVDMRTLTSEHGSAKFTMPIDTALTGSNRIEAHIVDAGGNIVRAGRTIFARNDSALKIEVNGDKSTYAPGEPAKLNFSVTDEQGKPKVAALGVQIVDQAVFALIDAKPGLLRTYFELNDSFNQPSYEIKGPQVNFDGLFFTETTVSEKDQAAAAQRKSAGALAALGTQKLMGIQTGSYDAVVLSAVTALKTPLEGSKPELTAVLKGLVDKGVTMLSELDCVPQSYCTAKRMDFADALQTYLRAQFTAYDFWGNSYLTNWDYSGLTLTSSGPDERASSKDDLSVRLNNADFAGTLLNVSASQGTGNRGVDFAAPQPAAGPGVNAGVGAQNPGVVTVDPSTADDGSTAGGTQGSAQPRVRSDFPETLYTNPSIITDAKGHASIDLTMADSITEWRVSTLANSSDGRLGGSESGVKVFQDFFVDVSFPATLTRGDEVSFPIAVYNYLDQPQTVQLSLQPGTWYSALGSTSTSVTLDPGQVSGVSFPVRVNDVGLQTLTVQAIGSVKSDAVARGVRVIPDGKAFPGSHSGALKAGDVTQSVSVPSGAVPGSAELYVNVFPAFVSQAVQGMDSLLRVPNGCFEQTTSTAWPNVLVTQYMKDTKQITPEIQLKAESLMSAGYQRLLTFEHPGGGFSWFGTQDKAPFLSVTAFGLMEFADMSKVQTVDEAMVERTKSWLLAQQAQDGSWKGDMSEFFSFQTSVVRNTAFVVWALASAGVTGDAVNRGLSFVKANLGSDQDPYTLGLVANAFALAATDDSFLSQVLSKLDGSKKVDGEKVSWDSGGTQTNFYCSGAEADVSSTALIVQAMITAGGHKDAIDGGLKFLLSHKDPQGNFGSTQSTIWTLRALIEAARHGGEAAIGDLSVYADGELVQKLALSAAQSDVMTTVDLGTHAAVGAHDVKLAFSGTGQLSYNLVSSYNVPWASLPPEPEGPIAISLSYDKASLFVNDTVSATAIVKNTTASVENMVLVTLGIPPGFQVQTSDLDQYLRQGALSRYEMTGRQLILYLTSIAPKASAPFTYHLQAIMPVKALDGGAEAHLYYEPTTRAVAAGQLFEVKN